MSFDLVLRGGRVIDPFQANSTPSWMSASATAAWRS